MNKYKRLLTNTIVFAIGTFTSKLLVLLLTPVYTSILSPEQYSIADLVMQTSNLLIPIFSVSIASAVMRFGMDSHEDKASVFTTGFTTIAIGFAALLVCSPALMLLKDGINDYVHIICGYVLASSLHSLCLQFVRSQGRVKLFAIDGILNTILTIVFNIVFLIFFDMHITGYLMSTVLADALCAIFLFVYAKLWRFLKVKKFDKVLARAMLRYSIPLIPTTILWWVTNVFDRYMVKYMLGDFQNGLYVVAYKIPTILVLVSMVFADAWQMSAVSEDRRTRCDFFGKVFYSFQSIVFIGASGLIMLSQLAMHLLTYKNPAYFEGWRYMPILIIATAFNCLVTFQSTVYIVEKRSVNSMWTSLVGAVINIGLNALLIPLWGVNGASFATFVSYFTIFWLRYFDTRKFIPFNTHLARVCFNTVVLGVQCVIILTQIQYWFWYELGLVLLVTAFNFKPLMLSITRLLKRDGRGVAHKRNRYEKSLANSHATQTTTLLPDESEKTETEDAQTSDTSEIDLPNTVVHEEQAEQATQMRFGKGDTSKKAGNKNIKENRYEQSLSAYRQRVKNANPGDESSPGDDSNPGDKGSNNRK